jgi:hypothetical protein
MKCKNCGAELPEDARLCRKCGTEVTPDMPLKELEKEDTPPENTEIGGENQENQENAGNITEQLTGEDVVTGNNVNEDQLEAFESGKPLTFIAADEDGDAEKDSRGKKARKAATPKPPKPPKPPKVRRQKPEPEPEPKPPKRRRVRRAKVIRSKAARSRNPLTLLTTKLRIPAAVLHITLWVCVAGATFVLGYLTHYYGENLQYETETNRHAIDALDVLMSTLPAGNSFQADDLYVKSGVAKTEVLIFGEYEQPNADGSRTIFRVLKQNGEYTVYYPFDETLYDLLKNSEDSVDRITAAAMKSHEETLNMDLNELSGDSPLWRQADSPYVCYVVYRDYSHNTN